jgi:hypothetical protein
VHGGPRQGDAHDADGDEERLRRSSGASRLDQRQTHGAQARLTGNHDHEVGDTHAPILERGNGGRGLGV